MSKNYNSCCEIMAMQLAWKCDDHSNVFECPDALITKSRDEYGLIVHDGGSSYVAISHCPWCGTKL